MIIEVFMLCGGQAFLNSEYLGP